MVYAKNAIANIMIMQQKFKNKKSINQIENANLINVITFQIKIVKKNIVITIVQIVSANIIILK